MDNIIKPFDNTEVHAVHELCVRSNFDKLPGQQFNIKSEILIPPGKTIDPSVVATMLIGGLNIWCYRVIESEPSIARDQAKKILPLVNQMLAELKMLNLDVELKNMINQLDKKIDEILKSNDGNDTNTKSNDRITPE